MLSSKSIYFYITLIIIYSLVTNCFNIRTVNQHQLFKSQYFMSDDSNRNDSDKKNSKSTKFDRILDDFIGKKYGAGEAFYGKRTSNLSEEEYKDLLRGQKGSKVTALEKAEQSMDNMKDNAILLVGDASNDMFQWIVFELAEKGFRVRVCSVSSAAHKAAIFAFGLPGFNVDMIELDIESNNFSEERCAKAVKGVQAIVVCENFNPKWKLSDLMNGPPKVSNSIIIIEKILNIAIKAERASVGTVQKVVCVSRYLPWIKVPNLNVPSNEESKFNLNLNSLKQMDLLSDITEAINKILISPDGGVSKSADKDLLYKSFHAEHKAVEDLVINSGFEYVVLRTPATVLKFRPASIDQLATITFEPTTSTNSIESDVKEILPSKYSKFPSVIAELDVSEAAVQVLLQDQIKQMKLAIYSIDQRTKVPKFLDNLKDDVAEEIETPSNGLQRISRNTYYSILDLANKKDEKAMQESYLIKPAESYRAQLQEDQLLETYWTSLILLNAEKIFL